MASEETTTSGGGDLVDQLYGGTGDDVLDSGQGGDVLDGGDGNDQLYGGTGADTFLGGAGNDVLGGTPGTYDAGSQHFGPWAGNTYHGGAGNDTLNGTVRVDVYQFDRGDGHDTVLEPEYTSWGSSNIGDILRFGEGVLPGDVTVVRSGSDMTFRLDGGAESVTVKNWYSNQGATMKQVERVEFSDGTVWLAADLTAQGLVVVGTDASETITGHTSYVNVLRGSGGNDTLTGGGYADQLFGDAGDDQLFGGDGENRLEGGDGNDSLSGNGALDTYIGGAGNDILGGAAGSYDAGSQYSGPLAGNVYHGGAGNDTLNGTVRVDLYHFNRGDGHDTVLEPEYSAWSATNIGDILRFGEGITPADVSVARNGSDLVFKLDGGAESVIAKSWFTNQGSTIKQIERVEFSDGTVWLSAELTERALTVDGTSGNDSFSGHASYVNTIRGHEGNDYILGGGLADQLFGGQGSDTLGAGNGDDLLEGGQGNDTLDGSYGNDAYRYFIGDGYDSLLDYSGSDTLSFEGVDLTGASFYKIGNDLEVYLGAGQGVLVRSQFAAGGNIDFFLFGGQSYTASQVNALAGPKP